jgi:hypothetical protein
MNYPNFPLYESLKNNEFKELTDDEKDTLVEKIKNMNDEKQEIVYALMKVYYIEEKNTVSSNELPYNGKELKNRLKFDMDHIPSKLQYILKLFSLID